MSILLSISTVLFLILCVLLIIIILLQSDKSAGMGILGGSSQSAFGSSTADVITKATAIMVAIFLLGSLGLSVLETKISSSLEKKVLQADETVKTEAKLPNQAGSEENTQNQNQQKTEK
ncbi:MAG TPA: preprotein translocase subunit SecG [Spirochaetota bacterium]|nr:preprotein translocase subunit SecG [Spirochaetota bacterium]HRZ25336.1 preprotein translocase subunit SecG [Spirochaetota bacterium]HSA16043.1 preprotein translocase subunit SecG [Spirochaetota bacterium]